MKKLEDDDFNKLIEERHLRKCKLLKIIFGEIFSRISENAMFYVGYYIEDLYSDFPNDKLFDWMCPLDSDYGWYSRRFLLTKDCKEYLLNESISSFGSDFCHYMIRDEEKVYVVVFDGCHFDIDASIKIPREVIDECGREFEMDFRFSDPVEH